MLREIAYFNCKIFSTRINSETEVLLIINTKSTSHLIQKKRKIKPSLKLICALDAAPDNRMKPEIFCLLHRGKKSINLYSINQ